MIRIRKVAFLLFAALLLCSLVVSAISFLTRARLGNGRHRPARTYPSDWLMLQRTFPYGTADRDAHTQAIARAHRMRAKAFKSTARSAAWEAAGPKSIGGRVSAIAISGEQPPTIYLGAATGGVFKSVDGGESWLPVFDEQAILSIGDIAVGGPQQKTVYVGTGEANGGHNNFPGAGLFKSTDGAISWRYVGLARTLSISRIVFDPAMPQRVYVAAIGAYFAPDSNRGIYKTEDGGESWQQIFYLNDSTGVIDLVIHPEKPNILFAAAWERIRPVAETPHFSGWLSGIYRSTDAGESWERLGTAHGLPGPQPNIGRIGLAICQSQPENMYALYTDGFNYTGLYRSKDGGESWQLTDPAREIGPGTGGFSWYFGQVRVHPENPEKVFVLDVALMGSEDGGLTWPLFFDAGQPATGLHVDHHALAFFPGAAEKMLSGHDGGISISEDNGHTWRKTGRLPITQFYKISHDPGAPSRLYGGTQDNGTVRSAGDEPGWEKIFGGDGFNVFVDPQNSDIIYAESQFGAIAKSFDGGRSWTSIRKGIQTLEPSNWAAPFLMDPNDPETLYYGTYRVYKTRDSGFNWKRYSPKLTDFRTGDKLGTITAIAPARADTSVLYVGTDDAHVWVTADAGASWQEISTGLPYRWVTCVQVDPFNPAIAYVTFSGLKWNSPQPHVFRTTNMGVSWQDISSNLPDSPVNVLRIDPLNRSRLFVGTDVGVFVSENAGQSWVPLGIGMPIVPVYDLTIDEKNNDLIAATHGRSVYRIFLDPMSATAASAGGQLPTTLTLWQNYPNPFNAETRISFSVPEKMHATVRVYDRLGRAIQTLLDRDFLPGEHTIIWDGRDARGRLLPSGVYFCKLEAGGQVRSRPLVLLK